VFWWTPPHYWPLSIRYREEYAAAQVPMLPVVATDLTVSRQIIIYSWIMVATSLLLWPATGWVYRAVAVLAGAWFVAQAHVLRKSVLAGIASSKPAMRLFHGSITYLSLVFLAVGIDPFVS